MAKRHANRIREFRKKGLRGATTQEDLARAVGLDPTTVNKHESGARRPTFEHKLRYARVLGVSADTLFPEG